MTNDKRNETNNLQGDIWNDEDDKLLVETILQFVKEGKTVINGCREMEEKTEGRRTTSASKFRWFTKLVHQYRAAYELAKEEGKKVKEVKKKKLNKGERFEEIVETVFQDDTPAIEREIDADDFIILAKKFKQQQMSKIEEAKQFEKNQAINQRKVSDLEKELKQTKAELKDTIEMLQLKQKDYQNILEALNVLKKAGIQITIPEPSKTRYSIGKNGLVEKAESP